jgi:hypothetical protein
MLLLPLLLLSLLDVLLLLKLLVFHLFLLIFCLFDLGKFFVFNVFEVLHRQSLFIQVLGERLGLLVSKLLIIDSVLEHLLLQFVMNRHVLLLI